MDAKHCEDEQLRQENKQLREIIIQLVKASGLQTLNLDDSTIPTLQTLMKEVEEKIINDQNFQKATEDWSGITEMCEDYSRPETDEDSDEASSDDEQLTIYPEEPLRPRHRTKEDRAAILRHGGAMTTIHNNTHYWKTCPCWQCREIIESDEEEEEEFQNALGDRDRVFFALKEEAQAPWASIRTTAGCE